SARAVSGRPASVLVLTDGSSPNTASFVANYARGVVTSRLEASRAESARGADDLGRVIAEPRFWYNPDLESRAFITPGAIAIVMTMIGTMLTALVVAREWERGTMEAMMATPLGIGEFLIGKLLPYFGLGLGATLLCAVAAEAWLGVPLRGSVPALLVLFSGFLPAFLLSGFLFEIASMPERFHWLTRIVAARYFVAGLQTLYLTGDVRPELARSIWPMFALGAVFFALAEVNTRK